MNATGSDARLLFVNYHYIRSAAQYAYPGIHPIEEEAFEQQVDRLADAWRIYTVDEVERFVDGQPAHPGDGVFLTFDDGLVDHGRVARDVLAPRHIQAAFFVASRPLLEGRALAVHKVHWLRATTPSESFREEFLGLLPDDWRAASASPDIARKAVEQYVYDTPEDARLKFLINFRLPVEIVDTTTSSMLVTRGINECEFCGELYMDEAELRSLYEAGHVIGLHGHTHSPFSCLEKEGTLDDELQQNAGCLERICGVPPTWVSYPFGREWSLPSDLDGLFARLRLSMGVTLLNGWNVPGEQRPLLKRINTNEVAKAIDED